MDTCVVIEETDYLLHSVELATRIPITERLYLEQHHNLHNIVRNTVTGSASMRFYEIYLYLA